MYPRFLRVVHSFFRLPQQHQPHQRNVGAQLRHLRPRPLERAYQYRTSNLFNGLQIALKCVSEIIAQHSERFAQHSSIVLHHSDVSPITSFYCPPPLSEPFVTNKRLAGLPQQIDGISLIDIVNNGPKTPGPQARGFWGLFGKFLWQPAWDLVPLTIPLFLSLNQTQQPSRVFADRFVIVHLALKTLQDVDQTEFFQDRCAMNSPTGQHLPTGGYKKRDNLLFWVFAKPSRVF